MVILIFIRVWSIWAPWHFIDISCLMDIFHMPLHISSCFKGFVAVRTWNIFINLLMLCHLLVVHKRFLIFFACSRYAHPKARLGFMHSFIVVVQVGFGVSLVLANITRIGLLLLWIQTVAFPRWISLSFVCNFVQLIKTQFSDFTFSLSRGRWTVTSLILAWT